MKIEIIVNGNDPGLFEAHAEFNQISGALMAMISEKKKKKSIQKQFPVFCAILDNINDAVSRYAIT